MRYFNALLCACLVFVTAFTITVKAELPIYAAYISEALSAECARNECQLNVLNGEQLTALVNSLENALELQHALSTSDYAVLVGNVLISKADVEYDNSALVFEITTTWRDVPIDDVTFRSIILNGNIDISAVSMLVDWAQHVQHSQVLEADKIYQTLGASNYLQELQVPRNIGEFVQQHSAIYRDPMLGSITRYSHPQFTDAIVDISVYPFSPFSRHAEPFQTSDLTREMNNEITQIKALIAQAHILDFDISDIEPALIRVNGQTFGGLRLKVLLNTDSDPIYSTQYVFQQNDKVIKLTGNIPVVMMDKLVTESLPQIKVPLESSFMKSLRRG